MSQPSQTTTTLLLTGYDAANVRRTAQVVIRLQDPTSP